MSTQASFAQRRLWFLDQLAPGSADYLLPLALRLRGTLDVPALERALVAITDRHEVLRTRFVARDGEPHPVVDPPGGIGLDVVDAADVTELFDRELRRGMDLATEPPVRLTLARLGAEEHVLLVVIHHIAVDGYSWDVLLTELADGYRGEPVAPPTLRYADVAARQRDRLADGRMERLLTHWRDRLAGVPPLTLPADRPRPPFWDGAGDVVRFTVPADLVAEVDHAARTRKATRYMLLLAVYQALLARYTGQTDLAVCTTLSDRTGPAVAGLVGPFVNTVVLRTDLAGRPDFDALLGRVRRTALDALSHAEAPFDHVVGAVRGDRDLSRHPLAQASFTLVNSALRPITLPGLEVEQISPPLVGTPMDVFLDLNLRTDGSLAARLQYATTLFDDDSMRRFADGYRDLLRAVLAEPGTPVADLADRLEPLPGRERQRLLDNAGTATASTEPLVVHGAPSAIAVRCGDQAVTYAELAGLAGGLANALRARGVGRGSAVGVCVARGVWSVAAMLAVWRAGGVYVPLDPALPPERLRLMVAEADVGLVVADESTSAVVPGVPVVTVEAVEPAPESPVPPAPPADLAYVIFTSGSSGRPKAVGVSHGALAAHVAAARETFGVTSADRVLAFSSFSFDASLDQLLPALTSGAEIVVRPDEQWLPTRLPEVVAEHGITVLNLPPTFWAQLAATLTDRQAGALRSLRLLILGGEEVPAPALAAWRTRVPWALVCNAYGPTEAVVTATVHTDSAVDGPVPVGRPLGGRRAYVVDDRGHLATTGELLIGGPELAVGYLGRSALTAEKFVPDPFGAAGGRLYRTGDRVRWRDDGELEFLGRADDQVKIRGFRVELGEVESVLARCPGVRGAAAAVGADGQSLTGYVVADQADTTALRALRDWCGRWLPGHAVPADLVVLDALPVTASGKLDRAALPAARRERTGTFAEPRDDVERAVAEIWREVLGVDRVGIDDSFFDLGGHSLLATMVVARVTERLGRAVELRTLFEHPRIREFAAKVRTARATRGDRIEPVDRTGPLPLSFAQERLWFLDRMAEPGAANDYVLWFTWRVRGDLDRDAWQGALDDVVARHEVLRTALVERGGAPVQLVRDDVTVPVSWHAEPHTPAEVRQLALDLATRRFDLTSPPMLRSGVWALEGGDHVVLVAFHHIATDGWSTDVVLAELAECYRARRAGHRAELPAPVVQYGDYAVWQRRQDTEGDLAYWRDALDGVPVLDLPADRPRPATRSGRGGAVLTTFSPESLHGLDELAHRLGVTRFTVLLAVFQVVLARWSGQHDVPVGTPVAGRGRVELERLVGFFVNTVVLRGDLSGRPSFVDVLDRARRTVLDAFDHQDVPFERLVELLRPERDLSRNPLFQVMFDVREGETTGPRFDGLEFDPFPLPWGSAKFDLTANFVVHPDRVALDVEYSTDLFDHDTVARFAEWIGRVLDAVAADPHAPVGDLDLLTPAERTVLLDSAGAPDTPVTAGPFALAGEPGDVALVCEDRIVHYGELGERVAGLAAALVGAGVRRGDPVGVCLPRGTGAVAAMLAVWHAGGVYVPLDPRFPQARLRHMVAEAGVTHVIGTADLGVPVVSVDSTEPGIAAVAPDPDELAYVIFTSGSSGRPKAVGVPHGALAAHVAEASRCFGITATDRVLTFASTSFDASLEQMLPALAAGARVVIRPDEVWSADDLARRVRAEGVTVLELTPAYLAEVVARLDHLAGDLAGLRLLVTGGETLPPASLREWFTWLPDVPVVNTYGPTESVISATAHRITGPVDRVPIGRALGGRHAYVVDADGDLVPSGVPGELLIGGPELAHGYLGRPALTASRFVPDPFADGGRLYRTGDRVRRLPDGDLEFLGRVDDQISLRGMRIEPGEIEAVLREHPDVRAATVVVRDGQLVAYVSGTEADLRGWCGGLLPSALVPSAVIALDDLPLTVQGKVDVAALPAPGRTEFVPPDSPTEQVVAQIWAEVLGADRIGLHDDFFVLGGHSLRAVAVASRLRAAFDCPVGVRDLFEHPTVERLAAEVERQLIEQIALMSDEEIALSLS